MARGAVEGKEEEAESGPVPTPKTQLQHHVLGLWWQEKENLAHVSRHAAVGLADVQFEDQAGGF